MAEEEQQQQQYYFSVGFSTHGGRGFHLGTIGVAQENPELVDIYRGVAARYGTHPDSLTSFSPISKAQRDALERPRVRESTTGRDTSDAMSSGCVMQ